MFRRLHVAALLLAAGCTRLNGAYELDADDGALASGRRAAESIADDLRARKAG